MNDLFDRARCLVKGHIWKHYAIVSLYADDRGGPPNKKKIKRKCLSCGARKSEVIVNG